MITAKEALKLFLRSLPLNAKFQIISFGTNFALYKQGNLLKNNDKNIEEALLHVSKMAADFGGTNIFSPLEAAFKIAKRAENEITSIFVLTDGDVFEKKEVIDEAAKNDEIARTHMIGVGAGASRELVTKVAEAGRGKATFVVENDNMNEKVIEALDAAMEPFLSDVQVKI